MQWPTTAVPVAEEDWCFGMGNTGISTAAAITRAAGSPNTPDVQGSLLPFRGDPIHTLLANYPRAAADAPGHQISTGLQPLTGSRWATFTRIPNPTQPRTPLGCDTRTHPTSFTAPLPARP